MTHVCIIGLGYVGLPTAAMFSLTGHHVTGVDSDAKRIDALKSGLIPFSEPDLDAVVRDAMRSGNLAIESRAVPADVFVICVPATVMNRIADLANIEEAARAIATVLRPGNMVIVESTVPPGTTVNIVRPILETSGLRVGENFYLAYCPERVMPTNILSEIEGNNRVIGGVDGESGKRAGELYGSFVRGTISFTDCTTAEFGKLIENAFRDVNIAFANECALIAEEFGVDVREAIELANRHPRVNILRPGPGVGGHCLPTDPWFLVDTSGTSTLIPAARAVNDFMPGHVADMVLESVERVEKPKIAVWGLAYKGNTGDVRGSPAIKVMSELRKRGAIVGAYDPHVGDPQLDLASMAESVDMADCILVLNDHRRFKNTQPSEVAKALRRRLLIDTVNCMNHQQWRDSGFRVRVLGDGRHRD